MIRTPRSGFTLAEIVVVLLILGLTAALVTPAIRAAPSDPLDGAADELVRVLETARRAAAARGSTIQVTLRSSGSIRSELLHGDSALVLHNAALGAGWLHVDLDAPPQVITFDPAGTASPRIVRIRHGSASRTVAVDRWTGAVRRGTVP